MKTIIRFEEEDLRKMVARELDVPEDEVIAVYTKEIQGYGQGEHTTPVFYIEYEKGE